MSKSYPNQSDANLINSTPPFPLASLATLSAMHVYRNMGFVEVGRWKGYYLNGNGARRFKMCVSKTSLPKGVGK